MKNLIHIYSQNRKRFIRLLIYVAAILLVAGFAVTVIAKHTGNAHEIITKEPLIDNEGTGFLDGHQWKKIEGMQISPSDKIYTKTAILKTIIEVGIINDNPLLTPSDSLGKYSMLIDSFYADPNNLDIPIPFALKIADLSVKGMSDGRIQLYKRALLQKLKQLRLL
ncbi:MAG: hypothetical protein JW994_00180 [Candidatus Omnitrophica bacterium]|nr:hypothetical protein [Candidatus Omnitrophota bacterium]